MNISPGRHLNVLLQGGEAEDHDRYERSAGLVSSLARVTVSDWLDVDADAPESATALVGSMKLLSPMKDLIDKEAEAARLEKETAKAASELSRGECKLANEQFVGRAPPAVVEGERQRVAELRDALAQLHPSSSVSARCSRRFRPASGRALSRSELSSTGTQASSVAPFLAALLVSSFPRRRESSKTVVPLDTRVREYDVG
jgi:hypothetical protein